MEFPGLIDHQRRMQIALKQARLAFEAGEVPVGACIFHGNELVAQAHNQVETLKDPTAHAEMIAITQAASAVGDWRLADCTLYVTKEPCPMCAGAIVLARVPAVYWGMTDPLRGGAISRFSIFQSAELNHRVQHQAGLLEEDCKGLVQDFFKRLRKAGNAAPAPDDPG